jgi:methionyl-tRNA synthetase
METKPPRHLITAALPYINGVKHLGNLIGSLLPADVSAKFLRQQGAQVLFICGTDEHGTPAEIAAQAAGQPIETYCETLYAIQKQSYEAFGIGFDYFGRSSAPSNHHLTQQFFLALTANGFIQERTIRQYYSLTDQRFLPDRYLEGTCPKCGYAKARGDQCDGCSVLLDPAELLSPYSTISHSYDLELRESTHFFLDLHLLAECLETWIQQQHHWSDMVKGISKKWLNEGLQARCITRDLRWGIPIPVEGYENKVFYVWFDAPNAYISITQDWAAQTGQPDAWKAWWLLAKGEKTGEKTGEDAEDDTVHYTQFMAKDNVPFHAIFWPAVLFASDQGFRQVDTLKGFHWLTYEKGKFSTSQKRGVFADKALALFPPDYWRYYLLSHAPETADADFTFTHFAAVVNKDLADVLGNFVNRTFVLVHKYQNGKVPLVLDDTTLDRGLLAQSTALVESLTEHLSHLRFRQASHALRCLWVLGNGYIAAQKPWELIKQAPEQAAVVLTHCLHLVRLFGIVSHPFIPFTARTLLMLLQEEGLLRDLEKTPFQEGLNFQALGAGHVLAAPELLFQKIDPQTIETLTATFSGQEM